MGIFYFLPLSPGSTGLRSLSYFSTLAQLEGVTIDAADSCFEGVLPAYYFGHRADGAGMLVLCGGLYTFSFWFVFCTDSATEARWPRRRVAMGAGYLTISMGSGGLGLGGDWG